MRDTLMKGYGFGNQISIINGGIECSTDGTPAIMRIQTFFLLSTSIS